jgi:hypothetical protein
MRASGVVIVAETAIDCTCDRRNAWKFSCADGGIALAREA